MKHKITIVALALLGITVGSGSVNAQQTHALELPLMTEQHKMLTTLSGDWTISGRTNKNCPYGEGTFTAIEHCEWMRGGQFLVCRTQYSEKFKNSSQISFFGVDPKTKEFTYSLYSNLGVIVNASGGLRDKNKRALVENAIEWTEKTVNVNVHGLDQKTMKYTTEVVSPDEYRFSLVAGGDGWYDGVAKRVGQVINPVP
jgi:hypothetical protein